MISHVLEGLQAILREGNWKVTVAVYARSEIIAIWSGFHDQLLGMAVDVGSTTVAVQLCDLTSGDVLASAGMMNPQIRFGEDLMSRVSYVMMHPGGEKQMTAAVRKAVATLEREVCCEVGADPMNVLDVTFVGNPIMHHLLLGISPVELGGAPFALSTDDAVQMPARGLDLGLHPGARSYVLPCVAGHVGADAAGMVLCEAPHLQEDITLLVDVGTNAEIVLGNRHRLLAASSPTGPAFEGAQISCGQRAAVGAIERVRIDRDTLVPRFKVIGCDLWSTEEGFAAATDSAGITGVCGSGIIEAIAEMFLVGILTKDGVIRGELASLSPRIIADGRTFSYLLHAGSTTLAITQNDVRAIQLAKAALYAGIRLLMDHLKIDRVDRIRLAGAFGSHIDVMYAMVLGMIPDCNLSAVTSAGNAAGTGARVALLDQNARSGIEHLVKRIEKIETAVEPNFQGHFVEAMAIPHRTASYPELSQNVALPAVSISDTSVRAQSRGRKRKRTDPASQE